VELRAAMNPVKSASKGFIYTTEKSMNEFFNKKFEKYSM
jgi:hypothetical protein